MILAGDIGGTKTNIALFESTGGRLGEVLRQQTFVSARYDSLEAILAEFFGETAPEVDSACFGIAAPVIGGNARTPNLTWHVRSESLARMLGLARCGLINDLEATAFGIPALEPSRLLTLNAGDAGRGGHRALIAAGTGLGMAGIFFHEGRYHPIPSEGGHMDFAPHGEAEVELLRYLRKRLDGHVSYERVLSGPGLYNVYGFLRDTGFAEEPAWLTEQLAAGDKTAVVSMAALSGSAALAVKALDVFVSAYGAMAGNLALFMMATGGLYVGGGIAPKLRDKLVDGVFMKAFLDKGRFSAVLEKIPVHVILDDKTALFGAALAALEGN